MNRDLDDLVDLIDRLVPGPPGQVAPAAAPGIRPGADDGPLIAQLRDCWLRRYPDAGPHYLALRCWALLLWQPMYLSLFAARRSPIVPELSSMNQPVSPDGFVIGYTLGRHEPLRGNLRGRIQAAAAQLRNICATFYRELTQVLRVSPRAAESMQAECVLYALLAARQGDCARPRHGPRNRPAVG